MAIGRVPGATGIQPSIVDAKGDLIAATAADSVSRLAVGTNNQVLTADSAEATGLKYANEARATLTTTGDILYASAANTPARLGIGSTDQVLKVSGGVPVWGAAPAASFKGVRLEKTAAQSVANATYTAITYTGETYDTSSYHDNSTNTSRITIPAGLGGYYLIAYQISWSTSGNGQRLVRIYVNGTTIPYMNGFAPTAGGYDSNFAGATILSLSAGDYIELFGYQDSGGSLNCNGNNANGGLGRFEATLLGV